jgi:hypothetical protein
MGNYFCRMVVAPAVTNEDIERFALGLREASPRRGHLHVRDLIGRRVRRPGLIAARDAGVRVIDWEAMGSPWTDRLLTAADRTLGPGRFLIREQDDEDIDSCIPGPSWLGEVYGRDDLGELLELEEEPVPWNTRTLFVFPGVAASWPIDLPLNPAMWVVAKPGEARACPTCGNVGRSNSLRRHCPVCFQIFEAFPDRRSATEIVVVAGDAFQYGQCPRCMYRQGFSRRVQQCLFCGKVLRIWGGRFEPWELEDNEPLVRRYIDAWVAQQGSWISRLWRR